jgi:hypothetical protein
MIRDVNSYLANPQQLSMLLASLALLANLITLCIVIYQTQLTRRAVQFAASSFEDARRDLYFQQLPKASVVTHVLVTIGRWKAEVEENISLLEQVSRKASLDLLRELARKGSDAPRGLINRAVYDACPGWLQTVYEVGAQYYYDYSCLVRSLWDDEKDSPTFSVEISMGVAAAITRAKESSFGLSKLEKLFHGLLPEVYLRSPASVDERKFFDR